jgi:hypothetical protein
MVCDKLNASNVAVSVCLRLKSMHKFTLFVV